MIAHTPAPPYYAVIFSSLRTEGDHGYAQAAARIHAGNPVARQMGSSLQPALRLKPEVASLKMGSMNFGLYPMLDRPRDWQHGWEPELLASCYRRTLALATSAGVVSIALPSISTGVYGYPIELAAEVAVSTVWQSLQQPSTVMEVIFCCFSAGDLRVYERVLAQTVV